MKYKPSRDLPKFARQYNTLSAEKLAAIILRERNKAVKAHAISQWFFKHKDVFDALQREINAEELPSLEVSETIFQNGTFEKLPTVSEWIKAMKDRRLSEQTITSNVGGLKRVCKQHGIENATYKHPDRLTLDDARDYIRTRRDMGFSISVVRRACRDFLTSKGKTVGKKISGAVEKGKYKKLYIPVPVVREFLSIVKDLNFEIYTVDLFELKTATRITACLAARIENINDTFTTIEVFDKGRRSIYPKGHEWDKHIDAELRAALETVIGKRVEGKIFNLKKDDVRNINHTALNQLLKKYGEDRRLVKLLKMCKKLPTHWLRHEFFQHALHQTGWKYGVVAALGGSTVASLEESYGAPPEAIVKEWGVEWLNKITV